MSAHRVFPTHWASCSLLPSFPGCFSCCAPAAMRWAGVTRCSRPPLLPPWFTCCFWLGSACRACSTCRCCWGALAPKSPVKLRMETFKQLMAFPMYASVIWLLWVLTLQSGVQGLVMALTSLLAMVFIIWARRMFPHESAVYQPLALLSLLALLAVTLPSYSIMDAPTPMPPAASEETVQTIPYDKATLDKLREEGKPVFVDATAAWCITCQVNASVALHTPRTMKKFKELGITLMIADWTRRNPEITEFLAGFGFNGVPLNVYYPPAQGKPVVLPQLLSEDIVIQTIKNGE
ncbi:MAG: hypothetical protein EBV03_01295 [Proteobacteria bacterium]|nr:hypothetical protein [Pseudomonadota bacterium]